ncbi:MAG: acetyltransferase [Akkermansiaceae bacterium]
MKDITLYSCGSDLIVDFIEVASKNKINISQIVNNVKEVSPLNSFDWIQVEEMKIVEGSYFLIPLFTPKNRFLASQEVLLKGLVPLSILNDRNNDLPVNFSHGNGCFINKRVVIGADSSIGDFVLINRGACLGHHIQLENFVSIGPGVTTGGGVKIGKGALVGTGATILPEVKIGRHAIIGAGAVVTKDVSDNAIIVGNPAKQVSENKTSF